MRTYFIAAVLFIFSLSIFTWNQYKAGRWSDEQAIMEHGYNLITLIERGDFGNPFWYTYANDHPPFTYYIFGLVGKLDFIRFDPKEPPAWFAVDKGAPVYDYDLRFVRLIPLLAGIFSVLLTFYIGKKYFSIFVGISSALVLATLPHFVGYTQYVSLETLLTLFFSLCVLIYFLYLDTRKYWLLILLGVITGITIMIKEPNVIIVLFYPACFWIYKHFTKKDDVALSHFIPLGILTVITGFLLWPMIWFHPFEFFSPKYNPWFTISAGLTPDVMFGRVMGARWFYYFVVLFVTTPLVILVLTATGVVASFKKRRHWIYAALLLWFLLPLLLMFYRHRQHMVRYIIQIYVPMALLAAVGLESILDRFAIKVMVRYALLLLIVVYMVFNLSKNTPFYLTYFNELVGGTKMVHDKKWFLIGWFGEGLRGPGMYIAQHAPKNAKIGLATNPFTVTSVYRVPTLSYEQYNPKHRYDYIMVNYYNVIRAPFDEKSLLKDYKLVYVEKADSINFVDVYKHK